MRWNTPYTARAEKMTKVWRAWRALTFLLVLFILGCAKEPLISQESFVFGTRVEVLVYGAPPDTARSAAAAVLREFDRLHRTYHAWQPSELTVLNDALAAGKPAEVSNELANLIRNAQQISAQSNDLFDPGIGRLIGLWGFQNDEFKAQLPDVAQLQAWRDAHPSIADLRVDGNRVVSRNKMVALDFGGYLKGVALDRGAAILKSHGVKNALINIGGNIIVLGSKGGKPWRVAIQHPRSTAPLATLDLRDGEAIGTSGDYQRYFELNGKRYCHLLDPRTAAPVQGTEAVTILIPSGPEAGMRSDALSKPLFVAGTAWREQAQRFDVTQALRVDTAGTVYVTSALRERLKFETPDLHIVTMP
jgi:thiamine biosynthesis lipoprotein